MRIELRTDRDMEYVHMKDHHGSGTEPVNVLSTYKYRDGLGYYQSTRDTASTSLDYLPKGTYVFEYSVRVQHRGEYQTGMTNVQCMYAPEFNSHSPNTSVWKLSRTIWVMINPGWRNFVRFRIRKTFKPFENFL